MNGWGRRRKLSDERLHQAWVRCPDDGTVLVPTGHAYSLGTEPSGPSDWFIAFRCPLHPDETIPIGGPDLDPLLGEILAGVEVASLPVVGPGEL